MREDESDKAARRNRTKTKQGTTKEDVMANEVRIKLTDTQKQQIKEATGKDLPEVRVQGMGSASVSPTAKTSAKTSAKTAARTAARTSAKTSAKTAARTAARTSAKTSAKTAARTAARTSAKTSAKTSL
jgi:hypothetical protein